MMRSLITALLILWLTTGYSQSEVIRQRYYNVKSNLAIGGYDPVSYFDGKPLEGRIDITYTNKGINYRFSSQANLTKFKTDPEKYEPAYGGWCAYAMGDSGEKVKIDPETYKIVDGRLYLFYNFWTTNTLTEWNKNEKNLKEAGDRNWIKIVR